MCPRCKGERMDMHSFAVAQDALYRRIDEIGRRVNPAVGCFHDGVAFPDRYLAAKKKVLWVLKNSYDDADENGNPASDGMNIRDWFCDEALLQAAQKQIFVKMALVSHCIQNGLLYDERLLSDKAAFMGALQSSALVDLSKLPGGTSIRDRELKAEFALFRDVVAAQIALYAPDVIIFGNTLHLCRSLFSAFDYAHPSRVYEAGGDCLLRAFVCDADGAARLLLEAYHPSYPVSYADYVGTLTKAAL